jgi:hypothetical protein
MTNLSEAAEMRRRLDKIVDIGGAKLKATILDELVELYIAERSRITAEVVEARIDEVCIGIDACLAIRNDPDTDLGTMIKVEKIADDRIAALKQQLGKERG